MFNDLLHGDRLMNAWGMVAGVGLLFFLVQAFLCLLFCRRLRRQEQVIRRSLRAYEAGEYGRSDMAQIWQRKASRQVGMAG